MESNIALKIKALNYPKEVQPMINKFVATLSDEIISLEEMVQVINYLAEKGIVVKKPSEQKIFANGLGLIRTRVEEMERIGELGAYVEDPSRINSKGAALRIEYLKSIEEPYKTPEGKYSKLPFRKRAFEAKYGIEYLTRLSVEPNIEAPSLTEPIISPVVEVPMVNEKHKVKQVISASHLDNGNKDGEVEDVTVASEFKNPLDEILSKPQTIGLNDETFERYEKLADGIRHVMVSVYGIEEINDTITDNLIKLVTNEVMDDSQVMYWAITYGKTISPEEEQRLRSAISEELEYTSILEINLGGMAA